MKPHGLTCMEIFAIGHKTEIENENKHENLSGLIKSEILLSFSLLAHKSAFQASFTPIDPL